MLLVARVRRTLIERALLPRGACVVVGTSGGPDSTALLEALARLSDELGLRLIAAGIDHGLRPGAAGELAHAEAHAERLGVRFERQRVHLPQGSVHAEARRARYDALRAIARSAGASHVAVGHTLEDQAETVLARVLRGSGLRGLAGIDPAREDDVVRPLIDVSREEVRRFLADRGLAFAEDPSNADPRFERARIRHTVLPAMVAEHAEAALHLAWLADEARSADRTLEALAATLLVDATRPDGAISIAQVRQAPEAIGLRALRRALEPSSEAGLGRAHLSILSRWLQNDLTAAEVRLPGSRTARIVEGHVVVAPRARTGPDEEA